MVCVYVEEKTTRGYVASLLERKKKNTRGYVASLLEKKTTRGYFASVLETKKHAWLFCFVWFVSTS